MSSGPASLNDSDRLVLPWDLTQWFSGEQLLRWIEQELESLAWDHPTLQEHLSRHPEYRPREILTVMTWCYATGIFDSGEIAQAGERESCLGAVSGGQPVSEKAVARFRRENRGLLKWALVQLYRRALNQRYELGDWFPPGLKRYLAEAATTRLDLARQIDRGSSGF